MATAGNFAIIVRKGFEQNLCEDPKRNRASWSDNAGDVQCVDVVGVSSAGTALCRAHEGGAWRAAALILNFVELTVRAKTVFDVDWDAIVG